MTVEIVIPAHNEASILPRSVELLLDAIKHLPWPTTIAIAENGSVDDTAAIGRELAASSSNIRFLSCMAAAKGGAIREAWRTSTADTLVFIDADLSTNLDHLADVIAPIENGDADVSTGTRRTRGAVVQRTLARRFYSLLFHGAIKAAIPTSITDLSCGCKAIGAETFALLDPVVVDDGWFFDVELLLFAERHAFTIVELPVRWNSVPSRSLRVGPVASAYLRWLPSVRRRVRRIYGGSATSAMEDTTRAAQSSGGGSP